MISTLNNRTGVKPRPRQYVVRQIAKLRAEVEDLRDYLDLLEARAKNRGRSRYTTAEVKRALGIK